MKYFKSYTSVHSSIRSFELSLEVPELGQRSSNFRLESGLEARVGPVHCTRIGRLDPVHPPSCGPAWDQSELVPTPSISSRSSLS
jgi:hypothetical protein